jgi:hypothetical protein
MDNLANFLSTVLLQTKPMFCRLLAWSQGWTFLQFLFQSLLCLNLYLKVVGKEN